MATYIYTCFKVYCLNNKDVWNAWVKEVSEFEPEGFPKPGGLQSGTVLEGLGSINTQECKHSERGSYCYQIKQLEVNARECS